MENLTLFHIGCGGDYHKGFVNIDRSTVTPRGKKVKLDLIFELGEKWPYNEDNFVDGIVSMHVLQQLSWRDLVTCLREAYRVLKKGGVMRFGVPVVELYKYDLDYLLGWNNINLFSRDLLENVFERIGFSLFEEKGFGKSKLPILTTIDNRENRGTLYFEATK
jgi:predicted SAM-dependent methyltransferase